jgi:hypothetical protein
MINRSLVIIRLKQPFADWANNLPDVKRETTTDELNEDSTVILIPDFNSKLEAKKFIAKHYSELFDEELFGWCTNEDWWPQKRTEKMFWEWFDVEFHSEIIDLINKPIIRDED